MNFPDLARRVPISLLPASAYPDVDHVRNTIREALGRDMQAVLQVLTWNRCLPTPANPLQRAAFLAVIYGANQIRLSFDYSENIY